MSDVKHAMEDANIHHVTSGLESVDAKESQFISLPDANIHAVKDCTVNLQDVVNRNEPPFKQSSLPLCIEREFSDQASTMSACF